MGEQGWRPEVLRRVLDDTTASVIVLRLVDGGRDAVIELIDRGTANALGQEVGSLVGNLLSTARPAGQAREVLAQLQRAREEGDLSYEAVRDLPSGRRTAQVQVLPLAEDRFLLFSLDISEEREASRRLRTLERVAGVGIYHWNVVTDELQWSDELYLMVGYQPGELTMTLERFLTHVHPDDRAEQERLIQRAREAGTTVTTTFRCCRTDGTERTIEARAEAASVEGQLQYVLGTMQDITERRAFEHQAELLRRTAARRRTSLQVHDRIVQGLSAAWLALELGDQEAALAAIRTATGNAQQVVQELLEDLAATSGIHAGDLLGRSDPGPGHEPGEDGER
jgi:PAS domain S-box-containing protein